MSTKNANRFVGYAATVFLAWGLLAGVVAAETYSVNASLSYKTPNHAAVIQVPASGSSFQDALQQVSGTCQVQNPPYSISIVRDSVALGSTPCLDGTFSLSVTLSLGQNSLLARTANVSGVYGPDSTLATVTLKTPTVAAPLPTGTLVPTAKNHTAVTNQGALAGLVMTSEGVSSTLEDTKTVILRAVVRGGQQPYGIQLQWGDGSTEARSLDAPGTSEFTHTYSVQKNYSVKIYVRDVLGAFTEYNYAIISIKRTGVTTTTNGTQSGNGGGQSATTAACGVWGYRWVWYGLVGIFLVLIILAYLLGYRRGYRRDKKNQASENPQGEIKE